MIETDQVMYLFFDSLQREHKEFVCFFWGAKRCQCWIISRMSKKSVYDIIYTNNELQINLFMEVNWPQ